MEARDAPRASKTATHPTLRRRVLRVRARTWPEPLLRVKSDAAGLFIGESPVVVRTDGVNNWLAMCVRGRQEDREAGREQRRQNAVRHA